MKRFNYLIVFLLFFTSCEPTYTYYNELPNGVCISDPQIGDDYFLVYKEEIGDTFKITKVKVNRVLWFNINKGDINISNMNYYDITNKNIVNHDVKESEKDVKENEKDVKESEKVINVSEFDNIIVNE